MYRIAKRFRFSASHVLPSLSEHHPCSKIHGHNYEVEVVLASLELNKHGFVVDFLDLDEFRAYLMETVDHTHLEPATLFFLPTAENLAKMFFDHCKKRWPGTESVRVYEAKDCWAEYSEEKE